MINYRISRAVFPGLSLSVVWQILRAELDNGLSHWQFLSDKLDRIESLPRYKPVSNKYQGTTQYKGVQSYFNTYLQSVLRDGVHNRVNTGAELAEYDPALYEYLSDFFNDFDCTPTCP